MKSVAAIAVIVVLCAAPAPAYAQLGGHVSVMFDALPDISAAHGSQHAGELRARVFAERRIETGRIRVQLSGFVEGLAADRWTAGRQRRGGDALARPGDLYVEFAGDAFDVRAGASRVVWGRLDEFQPTDVVNPIDLSRFLLEGRTEARLPVATVRGRAFFGASTLEGVLVPAFRRGRFDQLDEETSPFNLSATAEAEASALLGHAAALPRRRDTPDVAWSNLQGGARFTSTVSRVDWGVSAYRGFRTFPTVTLFNSQLPTPNSQLRVGASASSWASGVGGWELIESYPRFTMLGADFETARGMWGMRGEVAAFVDDELQSTRLARGVAGRSVEGGVGMDRRAGDYRIAGNVLWSRRGASEDPAVDGGDVSLVLAADRSFARATRTLRVFAVYDPVDETTFGRVIGAISVRDDVWVEVSGGLFTGAADDTLGRLTRHDFVYARLKIYF